MMMVLVSKQHSIQDASNIAFPLICLLGEDIMIQKCRASRFCYRASGFSSHLPCRMSSCGNRRAVD